MDIKFGFREPRSLLNKIVRERNRLSKAIQAQCDEDIVDAFFNFAVTAYHVKDWLIRHPNSNIAKGAVEAFISVTPQLETCRDICNHAKHFKFDYTPKTIGIVSTITSLGEPVKRGEYFDIYGTTDVAIVLEDGQRFLSEKFADSVISAWESFFKKWNIN